MSTPLSLFEFSISCRESTINYCTCLSYTFNYMLFIFHIYIILPLKYCEKMELSPYMYFFKELNDSIQKKICDKLKPYISGFKRVAN